MLINDDKFPPVTSMNINEKVFTTFQPQTWSLSTHYVVALYYVLFEMITKVLLVAQAHKYSLHYLQVKTFVLTCSEKCRHLYACGSLQNVIEDSRSTTRKMTLNTHLCNGGKEYITSDHLILFIHLWPRRNLMLHLCHSFNE